MVGLLRFAMPVVTGRGAGLGNELHSWAKAFIGSQVLGLKLLHPAWGLNKRPYWRYFGTSRLDRLAHEALRRSLPAFSFNEAEFRARRPASFKDALVDFAQDKRIANYPLCVVEFSGMWGGLPAVADALDFVRASLLNTRFTLENLYHLRADRDPATFLVGMHVRRGDFSSRGSDYQGKFNVPIPLAWFEAVADDLVSRHPKGLTVLVFGDATEAEISPLVARFPQISVVRQENSDVSDLLALAACNLIVCSISSFSMWACMLSQARYVWFAPQLTPVGDRRVIWPSELLEGRPRDDAGTLRRRSRVSEEVERPAGVPVGWDGKLSEEMHDYIDTSIAMKGYESDLLMHGSVT